MITLTKTISVLTPDGRIHKMFAPSNIGRTQSELLAKAETIAKEIGGRVATRDNLGRLSVYQP